jgi:hypothetical protein
MKGLESLSECMQKTDTDPILHHHLLAVLSTRGRTPTSMKYMPYPCVLTKHAHYEVFKLQDTIGWKQFTEGLISTQWVVLQHKYYQSINSRRSGKSWAAQLISKIWEVNTTSWTYRNQQLHSNSDFLNQLHGQTYLDTAIDKMQILHGLLPYTLVWVFSTGEKNHADFA